MREGTPRPERWNYARHEGMQAVNLISGEWVDIERSPKEGEEKGKIQRAKILEFDDQTGEALVVFELGDGKVATKHVPREKLKRLNPNGSQKEQEQ